jgi:hypothetical protein
MRPRASCLRRAVLKSLNAKTPPGSRPLRDLEPTEIATRFERALGCADGATGAHCVHELWMRGVLGADIERCLARLWSRSADSIPDWLPMRYVEWLPNLYDIASRFRAGVRGRSNIYLVLLDYSDSRPEPYGLYVGMSRYSPMQRFDQHKAGIRAAGSVLKRGLEALTGPTLHLQRIQRAEAERIEVQMAEVLAASGLFVKGGH